MNMASLSKTLFITPTYIPMSRHKRVSLIWVFVLALFSTLEAQDLEEESKFRFFGYTKFLQNTTFQDLDGSTLGLNFFHNRSNFRYFPNEHWTFALEARNRIFYGEQVKLDPTFADQIDQYNGFVDLSIRWLDKPSLYIHSVIDRAYADYRRDKWEVRLGRQRINWGINLIWNPNDWFNALNFLDFDYEERPGSDGIRFQYYTGLLSSLDVAFAPGNHDSTHVGALKYRFNTKGYDIQLLGGYYRGDVATGVGWAGSLWNAGFKGEASYFIPLQGLSPDTAQSLQVSISSDYSFGSGLYLSGGLLYNSNGAQQESQGAINGGNALASSSLSPKNLFPAPWSFSATASYAPTPLTNLNMTILYAPEGQLPQVSEGQLTLVIPTVTYSIRENWDFDVVGQVFLAENSEQFRHLFTSLFLRLKWSY